MKTRVFIDGKEGTTGLQIYERFQNRNDVEIMLIDEEKRKDVNERAKMINSSDITFLCLPDAAAIEAASLCTNPDVRIIALLPLIEQTLLGITASLSFLKSIERIFAIQKELQTQAVMQAAL